MRPFARATAGDHHHDHTDANSGRIDRRKLLRMGASVSGAALVAALPALPVVADPVTTDPIIALWAERNRLDAELTEASRAYDAAYFAKAPNADELDEAARVLCEQVTDLESEIAALEPVSPAGWAIQAKLLHSYVHIGPACDDADEILADRFLAYFERLAGIESRPQPVKRPRAELAPVAPLPVSPVKPQAQASRQEILDRYSYWLLHERERLAAEMYPGMPEPWRYVPEDRAASAFHRPIGSDLDRGLHGSPSGRARVMLAVAGVFTGPDADFDPRKWEGGAA